ncbi:hypothetical protein [Paracoccus binzhouensis]|uniref:hypothetical protein n=1 Tax=Paracoccus binzhouensis TaxID=2796149 RepID=UPI0018EEDF5E|nr:hypothetical protein [Paracoccus binzhouensis]
MNAAHATFPDEKEVTLRLTILGLAAMVAAVGCHRPAIADEKPFPEATESDDELKKLRRNEANAEEGWHRCESVSDRFTLDHLTDFQRCAPC